MIGVILSGGSGTRFWPRSRERYPKQFLRISGSRSMIQDTVERVLPLIPIDNIFAVTNEQHAVETCRQLAAYGFDPANLLAEPLAKNTAPALGFAAGVLAATHAEEVMAVFPADHVVKDPVAFRRVLQTAETVAAKGRLVTLAIRPTRPETGYGYIKKGAARHDGSFEVQRFVEKPDAPTAQKFIDDGDYFWNCGVFLWKVSTLLEAMQTLMPELHKEIAVIAAHTQTGSGKYPYRTLDAQGRKIYQALHPISVDYGILEKSDNVAVVPTRMPWSDVGSWSALEEISPTDRDGNLLTPNVIALDCSGSIIQGEQRLIAAVGARNLIVVDTADALLICDKARAQDVKKIVEKIKAGQRPEATVHATTHEPWGRYTVLEKSPAHIVGKLEVLPGEKLDGKTHSSRDKTWVVTAGRAEVHKDGKTTSLDKNQSLFIPRGTGHQLANPGDTPLTVLEIRAGEELEEDQKDVGFRS
ncbi:MAG: mannose-1-phosphate guanylyltransferase/mannose-6-phosphate isomerase [Nitrospinales bacterium]